MSNLNLRISKRLGLCSIPANSKINFSNATWILIDFLDQIIESENFYGHINWSLFNSLKTGKFADNKHLTDEIYYRLHRLKNRGFNLQDEIDCDIMLFDKENNFYNITVKKDNILNIDFYNITMNGVWYKNEKIYAYDYICDLGFLYNTDSYSKACRLDAIVYQNSSFYPFKEPFYTLNIEYLNKDENHGEIEQLLIHELKTRQQISVLAINYPYKNNGYIHVTCQTSEEMMEHVRKFSKYSNNECEKQIIIYDTTNLKYKFSIPQIVRFGNNPICSIIIHNGTNPIAMGLNQEIHIPRIIYKDGIISYNNRQYGFALDTKNSFHAQNIELLHHIQNMDVNQIKNTECIVESDCRQITVIDLLLKNSVDSLFIVNVLNLWRDKYPDLFSTDSLNWYLSVALDDIYENQETNLKIFEWFFDQLVKLNQSFYEKKCPLNLLKKIRTVPIRETIQKVLRYVKYCDLNKLLEKYSLEQLSEIYSYLTIHDVDSLFHVLGVRPGKRLKKIFYSYINKSPYELLLAIRYYKSIYQDYNILCDRLESSLGTNTINFWRSERNENSFYSLEHYRAGLHSFSLAERDRFFKINNDFEFSDVADSLSMMRDLYMGTFVLNNNLTDGCNNIVELHNRVVEEYNKMGTPEQEIIYDNNDIAFLEKEFDQYKIELPKTNLDIIQFGIDLKNCVGSQMYRSEHANKRGIIIKIYKNGQNYAVAHLDMNLNIQQIKRKHNELLFIDEIEIIQKNLLK